MITIEKNTILSSIKKVVRLAGKDGVLKVSIGDSDLTLLTTDLVSCSALTKAKILKKDNESGVYYLPIKILLSVIEDSGDIIQLKFGKSLGICSVVGDTDIALLGDQSIGDISSEGKRLIMRIPADDFRRYVSMCGKFVSRDRPVLSSICVNGEDMVATNGFALIVVKHGFEVTSDILIPHKIISDIVPFLEGEIEVFADDGGFLIRSGDDLYKGALINDRYPDYNKVIPAQDRLSGAKARLWLNSAEVSLILAKMRLAKNTALESYHKCCFRLNRNGLAVIETEFQDGSTKSEIGFTDYVIVEDFEISFNIDWFVDILSALAALIGDENLCISIIDKMNPIHFSGKNCTALLMPIQ